MGKHYKAHSNKKHTFHAANMLVTFQRRPGVAADRVIKDAGDAQFHRNGTPAITIKPVDGIYAVPLHPGETGKLELFDTVYTVVSLASGTDSGLQKPAIVNWPLPLLPKDSLKGVQQRLQFLGYYTSSVDGKIGPGTERAVLEFQADEGSLLIDGDPGPKTKAALDTYFSGNGLNVSGVPIIRKYLIRFERGVKGHAQWNYPHPDIRGGDAPAVSYFRKTGGLWSSQLEGIDKNDQVVYLGMKRVNLSSKKTRLVTTLAGAATADFELNPSSVEIPPAESSLVSFIAKDSIAEYSQQKKLEIRFGSKSGPVVGDVDVHVVPLKKVKLYLHVLDIKDTFGTTVANKWTIPKAKELIDGINAIWASAGIEFSVERAKNHSVVGEYPGTITNILNSLTGHYNTTEFYPLWQKYNEKDRINVYFANELLDEFRDAAGAWVKNDNDTMGYALSRKDVTASGDVGVCVKFDADRPMLARTIAHELGHVVELTSHPQAHSDDDGTDNPYRSDIWSRSRLMSKYIQYYDNSPHREWQNPEYGKTGNLMNCGALITVKKIKNDGTDDELKVARSAAKNPY